ncbi:MAG: histidinol-phosphate transaminase [Bacteroidota bacterium]
MTPDQLRSLVRKNVLQLSPYSSARDEFEGSASVYLDANENPHNTGFNRYPDPHQKTIKNKLSRIKNIPTNQIFLGNGSDEAIDLIIRTFCQPGIHTVMIPQPTYGMYKVSAEINEAGIKSVPLTATFDLDAELVLKNVDSDTRIVFLCSPNNPSGNLLSANSIEKVVRNFNGIVVVDEAYIDFADTPSWITRLPEFNNLVVLQTLSKAWGLASLRLGMAFAHPFIIEMMNKIKPPYNINGITQQRVENVLEETTQTKRWVDEMVSERKRLAEKLQTIPGVLHIYPSDANFLLVKVTEAPAKYQQLLKHGIVVRDRSNVRGCEGCLRITVGTPQENDRLLNVLSTL